MHQDYTKICRICMSDGSRDIFHKPSLVSAEGSAANAAKSVSPLERLLEKLRYVTMMKIEENDDLPRLLCDLCIVQLNVAYNFKRQAVENDTKLRQYFIENGISSNQTILINETASTRSSLTAANLSQQQQSQRFPILPLIIKTEPSDMDAFSDATTETNVEIERNRFESVASNNRNSSPEEAAQCLNNSMYSNDRSQSSMVYVNSGYEFNSETPSSDIEFVQNFQVSTNSREPISNGARQVSRNTSKNSSSDSSNQNKQNSIAKPSNRISESPILRQTLNVRHVNKKHSDPTKQRTRVARRNREIGNLSIDMIPSSVITSSPKERRRKLGQTNRVRPEDEKNAPIQKVGVVPICNPSNITTVNNKSPIPAKRMASSPITISSSPVPAKKINSDERSKLAKVDGTPKHRGSEKRKSNPEKMIVLNPFNASKNAKRLKVTNRRSDNNAKRKSQQKLLRPKIEPPANKKN